MSACRIVRGVATRTAYRVSTDQALRRSAGSVPGEFALRRDLTLKPVRNHLRIEAHRLQDQSLHVLRVDRELLQRLVARPGLHREQRECEVLGLDLLAAELARRVAAAFEHR